MDAALEVFEDMLQRDDLILSQSSKLFLAVTVENGKEEGTFIKVTEEYHPHLCLGLQVVSNLSDELENAKDDIRWLLEEEKRTAGKVHLFMIVRDFGKMVEKVCMEVKVENGDSLKTLLTTKNVIVYVCVIRIIFDHKVRLQAIRDVELLKSNGNAFVIFGARFSYLWSEYGSTFAVARVFTFLYGPPDFKVGQLDTKRYSEQYARKGKDAAVLALLPEQTPIYKDLASVVQTGVCVDIFDVINEYTNLASLKLLIESGGSLFLYSNTDDLTVPQDMYQMLSRPYAFNCILQLRTSTGFKSGHSYGHFLSDPQYENVQHIICCDSYAAYAYDFEFANDVGISKLIYIPENREILGVHIFALRAVNLIHESSNAIALGTSIQRDMIYFHLYLGMTTFTNLSLFICTTSFETIHQKMH